MSIKNWFRNIGPGPLVAAAFIGPGTVTICTLAGVQFGYALLWAMGLSIVATIMLQEMAARLGIMTQRGLAEMIRSEIQAPILKTFAVFLILSAIVVGNAAYEAGNISGGVIGLETIIGRHVLDIGGFSLNLISVLIGCLAFILLYIGNYKILESVLIAMVVLMSLAFLISALMVKPNLFDIGKGLFAFQFPENSLLTVVGLIGTTIVPYNLFLHASLVKEKWQSTSDLNLARKDTIVAVSLGGLVSMCVIISASAIDASDITNASDLAKGLEPLFGRFARYFLSIGLFSAGITSAITAPLAAAYVATGILGWKSDLKSKHFRAVWIAILIVGVICSSLQIKSITIIKFAQVANGILLPIIVGFLMWIMNSKKLLGTYSNRIWQNIIGFTIFVLSMLLSAVALQKVFEFNIF